MLSIYTLKSAAKAGSYYQDDNYYAKDGELQGVWFGKGAELLNMHGNAQLPEFIAALEGKLSKNVSMQSTTKVHRPGYDLTFSAPKSVSILAVVARDARVLGAHRIAVNDTLKYMENHYALTRVKKNGNVQLENTGNLLVVKFEHTDSRALDPNLHTHCVVMNATYRSDLKWRTLYFDEVYSNKMLLGVIYRGKLAQELMKLGYEIVQTSSKGLFELKGFPQKLIDQFSKRRQQITQELQELGLTGSKAAQIANFNTREDKIKVDPEHLDLAWTVELQKCGCSLSWLQEYSTKAMERGSVTPPNPYALAYFAVTKAASELSDWRSTFTMKDLKKASSGLSVSNYAPLLLDKVIAEQFKSGELLSLKNDLLTTQKARDLEILNVLNVRQSKNKVLPMVTAIGANYLTMDHKPELRQPLKLLLTNSDQQMIVSGANAKNYTEVLQPFVKIAYKHGFYPIGITQTFKRVATFSEELGIKRTQTINGFLQSCENRSDHIKQNPMSQIQLLRSKQIWILDFNSSISASQLNRLQNYAKEFGTRIIWSNNITKPQAAISALIDYKIKQCNLDNRQVQVKNFSLSSHPKINNSIDLTNNPITKSDWQTNIASVVLNWATHKFQERDAVFSLKDLQLELFSLGITVPKEVLQSQLDLALGNSLKEINESSITTQATVNLEQTCLQLVEQGKNVMPPIISKPMIDQTLTKGQQQAIELILTNQDRVVGIQGVAGSGKTTMLRSLNKVCLDANFEIIGLTVTTSAKERLKIGSQNLAGDVHLLRSGIKTLTVRKFLIESERLLNMDPMLAKLEYGGNKLFVLDEASFIGTSEMFAVLTKMEQLNTKLIVMGDYKQLSSVEAGRIFYLMLGSKMHSVAMTENVRFKSVKTLNVMQHIYKDQIPSALERLSNSLVEIPDHNERLITMAELYLQKIPEEQTNTILITPEHNDRKVVNHLIREGLKATGQLTGTEVTFKNLTQVSLTIAEQQKIYYFNEKDLICFMQKPFELKTQFNTYYQVTHKNLEEQVLVLEDQNSKEKIVWSPEDQPSIISLHREEERKLMLGDKIRWTKNNNITGIYNGQTATVLAHKEDGLVEIKLQDDKLITLNLKELINGHWDHAYAATAFVAQGADKLITIALVRGAYSKEISTCDLKAHDVIMVKDDNVKNLPKSKWVKILEISNDHTAIVQDRTNNTFTLDLKKSPTNIYSKNQAVWHVCPDPKTRKQSSIPKLTSIGEFLVSVTRGEQVTILVDHMESYQHALEQRLAGSRSALEYLDPNRNEVRDKVSNMIKNVTGKATSHSDDLNTPLKSQEPANQKKSLYNSNLLTIEQVINKLHANILEYATNWLGSPQKISGYEARWGTKGSLVVKLSGDKAGFWHDFEKGIGGKNLLSLYIDRFNCDFKTAMINLTRELNINVETKLFNQTLDKPIIKTNKKLQHVTLDAKKISYAQNIYNKGTVIQGTLAEKYLREFRGIKGTIPDDFKFCAKLKHPDLGRMVPALLAPIKNIDGNIHGIVRIFLNSQGNKLNETYTNTQGQKLPATVKANLGSMAHAAVIINKAKIPGTVYIAEGIETALSISQTKPLDQVFAALSVSNLKNVPLPVDTQKVILCADQDGVNANSNKALMVSANSYLERGLQVAIAYPEKIIGMEKVDFNDVLKHLGTDSITRSIQNAVLHKLPEVNQAKIEPLNKTTELNHLPINKLEKSNKELSL